MSNDDRPSSGKSTQAAQQNKISHRDRKHPWHLPYLKTCIIKNCRSKPYYDGETYFTCCLSCLREKELGPFYKNKNPRLHSIRLKDNKTKSYFRAYFSRQRINQRTKQVRATPLMNDTQ